jgi:lipoprotein-anchoring transpeptidase ErfK/SrfK
MSLSRLSPQFKTLFAIPFLMFLLAFPVSAQQKPNEAPTQAQTKPESVPAKPQTGAPSAQAPTGSGTPNPQAGTTPSAPAAAKPENGTAAEAKPAGETSPSVKGDAKAQSGAAASATTKTQAGETNSAETATEAEPGKPSVVINIDKSIQEMTVFVDGVELYTWPVSTGIRGYSTPSGTFTASSMNKIWYSKQWDNAPMPHAIFFTKKGHAIHGTLEEKKLGRAASHGCVRLSRKNAETLFALVEEKGLQNTQVVLTGTTPGGEAKVASDSPGRDPRAYPPPWFAPGPGYYRDDRPRRRGFFGRRWFQPYAGPPGYYGPRGNYYYPPRGLGPRW